MRLCTDCDHDVDRAQQGDVVKLCAVCSAELSKGRRTGGFSYNPVTGETKPLNPKMSDMTLLLDTPNDPRKVRFTEP